MRLADLLRATLTRYLGASMVALGADMGSFLILLRLGLAAAPASALGYSMGIAVHWWLSAHGVFSGVAQSGTERLRQKVLFLASALLGLGLTTGVVGLCAHAGLDPRAAKLLAVGVSFAITYILRARVVFAQTA